MRCYFEDILNYRVLKCQTKIFFLDSPWEIEFGKCIKMKDCGKLNKLRNNGPKTEKSEPDLH